MKLKGVKILPFMAFSVLGLTLAACNPATKGWSSVGGHTVSFSRLMAAKSNCHYQQARRHAIRLLYASGNKQKNEHKAAQILGQAERCMANRYGILYRSSRGYRIGQMLAR